MVSIKVKIWQNNFILKSPETVESDLENQNLILI
jgi:hypothetical protein